MAENLGHTLFEPWNSRVVMGIVARVGAALNATDRALGAGLDRGSN